MRVVVVESDCPIAAMTKMTITTHSHIYDLNNFKNACLPLKFLDEAGSGNCPSGVANGARCNSTVSKFILVGHPTRLPTREVANAPKVDPLVFQDSNGIVLKMYS
jgi:hypothetical protein